MMRAKALQPANRYAGVIIRSLGILLSAFGISTAFASSSAEAWLAGEQLERLDQAIAFYVDLQNEGGWETLQDGPTLLAGMREERVRTLRRRLRATEDFDDERMGADPLLFDVALTEAVMNFQARHGLGATGIVDRLTRQRLNQTPNQLLNQLRDSRRQWEKLPGPNKSRRVWVNIPEATVVALNGDQLEFSLKAIVGHPSRPTPQLDSFIKRIVVNPPWTVPRSIATNDVLPRQQQDPSYMRRNNIRIYRGWSEDAVEIDSQEINWRELNADNFPYRLRQDPGPSNSLGRYKFDFPNTYDVFLHDTPGQSLLGLSYRTLSSGCVRVEDSQKLATWLAADEAAAALRSAESVKSSLTRSVSLPEPVAVDLLYLTAWVDPADGAVQFRYDVYGRIPVM